MMRITETVKHLVIINVIFFVATMAIGNILADSLALYYPENPNFRYWQFVTHMFMHGGLIHILFNMYALWAFGSPLEALWGRNKFLVFYFASGLGAGLIYTLVNYYQFHTVFDKLIAAGVNSSEIQNLLDTGSYNTSWEMIVSKSKLSEFYNLFNAQAVGASGAIYGILVAFAFKYPHVELMLIFLPIPIKAKYFVPALVLLDLVLGLSDNSIFGSYGGGVAHFAHVGGALIGYLLMLYFQKYEFRRWG